MYLQIAGVIAFFVALVFIVGILRNVYFMSKMYVTGEEFVSKKQAIAILNFVSPFMYNDYPGSDNWDYTMDDMAMATVIHIPIGMLCMFICGMLWCASIPIILYLLSLKGIRYCYQTKVKLDKHKHKDDKVTY